MENKNEATTLKYVLTIIIFIPIVFICTEALYFIKMIKVKPKDSVFKVISILKVSRRYHNMPSEAKIKYIRIMMRKIYSILNIVNILLYAILCHLFNSYRFMIRVFFVLEYAFVIISHIIISYDYRKMLRMRDAKTISMLTDTQSSSPNHEGIGRLSSNIFKSQRIAQSMSLYANYDNMIRLSANNNQRVPGTQYFQQQKSYKNNFIHSNSGDNITSGTLSQKHSLITNESNGKLCKDSTNFVDSDDIIKNNNLVGNDSSALKKERLNKHKRKRSQDSHHEAITHRNSNNCSNNKSSSNNPDNNRNNSGNPFNIITGNEFETKEKDENTILKPLPMTCVNCKYGLITDDVQESIRRYNYLYQTSEKFRNDTMFCTLLHEYDNSCVDGILPILTSSIIGVAFFPYRTTTNIIIAHIMGDIIASFIGFPTQCEKAVLEAKEVAPFCKNEIAICINDLLKKSFEGMIGYSIISFFTLIYLNLLPFYLHNNIQLVGITVTSIVMGIVEFFSNKQKPYLDDNFSCIVIGLLVYTLFTVLIQPA